MAINEEFQLPTVPLVDAAAMLGVSYFKCRDLMLTGTLQGVRDGRHWLVSVASVEEAIAKRHSESRAPTFDGSA